jgi:2-keto-3-deoxy-L-rhamnonate aldolase RhmA
VTRNSRLLSALDDGRPVIGFAHVVQDLAVTEIFRNIDVDFVLIDMQHVAITIETLQSVLIALQPAAASVMVRPTSNDPVLIGQILDVGADALIVPMVNTAADARRAVGAARYPPAGTRSWGPRRTSWLGGAAEYARDANDSVGVFTQVETAEAVENLDEILSVPGLAGVMIGPADLAISLGYSHDRDNPAVRQAVQGVLDRCLERRIPFGFFAATRAQAAYWLDRGALVMNCGSDAGIVAAGVSELAGSLRSMAPSGRVIAETGG